MLLTGLNELKLIVYSDLPHLMNNRILDRGYMSNFPGGESLTDMAEAIQSAGFEIMTIDRYRSICPQRKALLISNMAEGNYKDLPNIIPAICFSLESPVIASRYYHHIGEKTNLFAQVYDWAGVSSRIKKKESRFVPISWPTTTQDIIDPTKWELKKFLVIINSNKKSLQWAWPEISVRNTVSVARAVVSNLRSTWIKNIDPIMKSELYSERIKAIAYFSKYESFDLYGGLWDRNTKLLNSEIAVAVRKSYRGAIPARGKLAFLQGYKFSLVYENTIFPGYLTEKIFDCFFAGVVPVYLGDPRVADRIPSTCFIDVRRFSSYDELANFMFSITESEYQEYLDAAKRFINSAAFKPFTSTYFAETIVNCLNDIELDKVFLSK